MIDRQELVRRARRNWCRCYVSRRVGKLRRIPERTVGLTLGVTAGREAQGFGAFLISTPPYRSRTRSGLRFDYMVLWHLGESHLACRYVSGRPEDYWADF